MAGLAPKFEADMRNAFASKLLAAAVGSFILIACSDANGGAARSGAIRATTAGTLHSRLEAAAKAGEAKPLIVDVREPSEFEAGHIDGALLAPLGNVEEKLAAVEKGREIVLVCRSGNRSGKAYRRLEARGYTNLTNLEGGMVAWQKLEYPVTK
jgi:rhodanese-related sulfurtransferase